MIKAWRIYKRSLNDEYAIDEIIWVDPNDVIKFHRVSTNRNMPFADWKNLLKKVKQLLEDFKEIEGQDWKEFVSPELSQDDIAKGLIV